MSSFNQEINAGSPGFGVENETHHSIADVFSIGEQSNVCSTVIAFLGEDSGEPSIDQLAKKKRSGGELGSSRRCHRLSNLWGIGDLQL